jgi:hypothetical protein
MLEFLGNLVDIRKQMTRIQSYKVILTSYSSLIVIIVITLLKAAIDIFGLFSLVLVYCLIID